LKNQDRNVIRVSLYHNKTWKKYICFSGEAKSY